MGIRELKWFRLECDHRGPNCWKDRTSWGTSVADAAAKLVADGGWAVSPTLITPEGTVLHAGVTVTCPACAAAEIRQGLKEAAE